ncbi:hypothetical protein GUJ93_ZPchr0004g39445 [Zizania palustris]|uniref:Uncharacterized protein n=1 Tax=Zizania palustris TaxID=103762 RepID=A0A8J5S0C2_ZIZPA|nr:hypothetical protein GUJ93_ZPchr0004g39445 [Zizania palustris]
MAHLNQVCIKKNDIVFDLKPTSTIILGYLNLLVDRADLKAGALDSDMFCGNDFKEKGLFYASAGNTQLQMKASASSKKIQASFQWALMRSNLIFLVLKGIIVMLSSNLDHP